MLKRGPNPRLFRYSTVGLEFLFTFMLFLFLGVFADRKLGSQTPGFTILGAAIGFGVGLYRMLKEVPWARRKNDKQR